mgnify:CR=1 FL=1
MQKLKEIKQTLKRINDPEIRERLLMVQASYKEPLREAAQSFGCVHGKVAYWRNRYDKQGLRGLHTKNRSGRPTKMTKEQATRIKRKVRKHDVTRGWQTKMIRNFIKKETGVSYSERHVIRISQKWGLSQKKPRQKYAYAKKEDKDLFIKKTSPS